MSESIKVPQPSPEDSNTARETGEYFRIAQGYVKSGVCVFCDLEGTGQFPIGASRDGRAKLLLNKFPRSQYDMLAIPTRHVESLEDLTQKEVLALHEMKRVARVLLRDVIGKRAFMVVNREEGEKTVPHYHDQIQPYWPGLVAWSMEPGRGDDLDQRAQFLKKAFLRLRSS